MRDLFNRTIEYLRISLTDRCNFRCVYCMPSQGIKQLDHKEILSYEEILRIVGVLIRHGLNRVRLTGGEPLVRKGVVGFVRELSALPLADIALTTNGSLLAPMAQDLKQAGLKRVNISLDTVSQDGFRRITGGGRIETTMQGIEMALSAGLLPLKLNVVATKYLTDDDLTFFIGLTRNPRVYVRFIEYMPIGCKANSALGISMSLLRDRIQTIGGVLQPAECGGGGGPATYCTLPGKSGMIGFISPISEHFCHRCNRIRLTADGKIKPCLLSNDEYDIKTPLRQGISDDRLAELLLQAVRRKPAGHLLVAEGAGLKRQMSQVGG